MTVPASRPGVSRPRLHVPPPSPCTAAIASSHSEDKGGSTNDGPVLRLRHCLAGTCPWPALQDVDIQSGVKRPPSQPSVPVKALPVLLWAPRLKTGVVGSTLNDGSPSITSHCAPMFEERPGARPPPPPTHPSSRSQTWTSLQGTTRSSAAVAKARLDVGTYLWVTFWSAGLTTSPHPRIHNEDGHHPLYTPSRRLSLTSVRVSSFPEAPSQLLPVCSPSSQFLLLHPQLLEEARKPSHAHTNPRPHFYPSPPWFGTPLSRTGYALRLAARECECHFAPTFSPSARQTFPRPPALPSPGLSPPKPLINPLLLCPLSPSLPSASASPIATEKPHLTLAALHLTPSSPILHHQTAGSPRRAVDDPYPFPRLLFKTHTPASPPCHPKIRAAPRPHACLCPHRSLVQPPLTRPYMTDCPH